jgi:hypothetical protein
MMFSNCKKGGHAYEDIDFGSKWCVTRNGRDDFSFSSVNPVAFSPSSHGGHGRNAGHPAPPAQIPSMRNYRTGLLPQVRRRNVDSGTGWGIPPEDLERVFTRFYRVKNEKTRYITGTGLGLPIIKSIVEAHHGTIDVKSSLDKGVFLASTSRTSRLSRR